MISELSSFREYAALQLKLGASKEEIRQAYLDMAKVWHPDRFAGDERLQKLAEEKMMEITNAYRALLEDPEFDLVEPVATTPPPQPSPPAPSVEPEPVIPAGERFSNYLSSLTRNQLWMIAGAVVIIGGLLGWLLSPSPPQRIGWKITTSDQAGEATIQRRALAARAAADAAGTTEGVGEIQINNQMRADAEMHIALAANPDNVLKSALVPADGAAIIHNLGPATYVIDLSFADHKTPPVRLGPFEIVQVAASNGTTEADRYEVTLKPNKSK
jgi:hypothetical protein